MKRSAWKSVAAVLAVSAALSVTVLAAPSNILGDLDQNERLNSADVRIMLRYMVGERSFTAEERQLADYDGNNRVDTKDARYVLTAMALDEPLATIATTTTTTATTTTTKPSLDDDGYYDDVVKP